jgi:hypothetical protein
VHLTGTVHHSTYAFETPHSGVDALLCWSNNFVPDAATIIHNTYSTVVFKHEDWSCLIYSHFCVCGATHTVRMVFTTQHCHKRSVCTRIIFLVWNVVPSDLNLFISVPNKPLLPSTLTFMWGSSKTHRSCMHTYILNWRVLIATCKQLVWSIRIGWNIPIWVHASLVVKLKILHSFFLLS